MAGPVTDPVPVIAAGDAATGTTITATVMAMDTATGTIIARSAPDRFEAEARVGGAVVPVDLRWTPRSPLKGACRA